MFEIKHIYFPTIELLPSWNEHIYVSEEKYGLLKDIYYDNSVYFIWKSDITMCGSTLRVSYVHCFST